jgi:hypothetical protein
VWPLRVKVREFIHYARRKPWQQREYQGQQSEGQGHHASHAQGQGRGAQHAGGHIEQGELHVATNRYALPGEGVSGGPNV